jgi:peptidoglycan/LPS O-acetylase OafA/YrhL
LSLLITLEIWTILWNAFCIFLFYLRNEASNITIASILENVFLLKTVNYILPAWYVPMILGVYLFLPFVIVILNKFNFKIIKFPLIVSIIFLFCLPTCNLFLSLIDFNLTSNIDLYFSGGVFGIYIILGYYIEKGVLNKISTKYIVLVLILSFFLCIFNQYLLNENGLPYKLSYDNIFLLILSCSIFELIRRNSKIKSMKSNNFINYISSISFAIFLVHNPIQYLIYQLKLFTFIKPVNVILMFILSFALSAIIIKILSLFKISRKYLLKIE